MNPQNQRTESVPEILWRRCTQLGLPAWHCDEFGAVITPPATNTTPRADNAAIATAAREVSRRARAGGDMRPFMLEGVGTLLPLHGAGTGVVLALGPADHGTSHDNLWTLLSTMRDDLCEGERTAGLLREFSGKLIQSYEETYTLFRVMRLLASSAAPAQQIHMVCRNVQQTLPFRWVAVAFREDDRVVADLRGHLVLEGDPGIPMADFDRILRTMTAQADEDGWTRVMAPADHELPALVRAEIVCDPITYNGAVIGMIVAGNKSGPDPDIASPEMQFIDAVADFLGTFHENIARFAEQRAMSLGTLHALSAAIDAKDPYTRGHSERVAFLSQLLAREMGMGAEHAERVRIAGLVHDVGKIGVPERILTKVGGLTAEEFAAIKRHPETGYEILKGISLLGDTLPGVLHHHERWDGKGYPHGLRGESIPQIARIIGLADTFDAMSSSRSYRPALPRPLVRVEIARCAGSQFDPAVAEAFKRLDLSGYDALLEKQGAASPDPATAQAVAA